MLFFAVVQSNMEIRRYHFWFTRIKMVLVSNNKGNGFYYIPPPIHCLQMSILSIESNKLHDIACLPEIKSKRQKSVNCWLEIDKGFNCLFQIRDPFFYLIGNVCVALIAFSISIALRYRMLMLIETLEPNER